MRAQKTKSELITKVTNLTKKQQKQFIIELEAEKIYKKLKSKGF